MKLEHDGAISIYQYYDAATQLKQHLMALSKPLNRLLALVDGPPGSTNHWARYPAVPLLLSIIQPAEVHVLLDDHKRLDEKKTGQAWIKRFQEQGYLVETSILHTEKGALLIKALKAS
jgi:hypothetical protein